MKRMFIFLSNLEVSKLNFSSNFFEFFCFFLREKVTWAFLVSGKVNSVAGKIKTFFLTFFKVFYLFFFNFFLIFDNVQKWNWTKFLLIGNFLWNKPNFKFFQRFVRKLFEENLNKLRFFFNFSLLPEFNF